MGVASDDPFLVRGLPHHEAHRRCQIDSSNFVAARSDETPRMSLLRRLLVMTVCIADAGTVAHAGAKDESAAGWLAPQWFNDWHDSLAAKGLNLGAIYVDDNLGNVSGGTGQGLTHLGRFNFSVDA